MADARLYIVNRDTRLACRFYSRLGSAYEPGGHHGVKELLDAVSERTATSDEFFITDCEGCIERIEGTNLFKFNSRALDEADAIQGQIEERRVAERVEGTRQIELLRNQVAALGRKLLSHGISP